MGIAKYSRNSKICLEELAGGTSRMKTKRKSKTITENGIAGVDPVKPMSHHPDIVFFTSPIKEIQ
jgi:hypothetical protein